MKNLCSSRACSAGERPAAVSKSNINTIKYKIIKYKKNNLQKALFLASAFIACMIVSLLPASQAFADAYDDKLAASWNHFKTYKISPEGHVWADEDGSNARVFSESQSYGMLRAVWMNDQVAFDIMWNWTKNNLQRNNLKEMYFWNEHRWITPSDSAWQQKIMPRQDYLIAWRWLKNADGSGKQGIIYYDYVNSTDEWKDGFDAATDADEDIALALVFADSHVKKREWQPNFNYLQDAKNIVGSIWDKEVFLLNPNMLDDFRDVMEWGSWQSCDGSHPGCGAWATVSQSPNPNKMKLSYYKPSYGYVGAGTSLYRDLNTYTGMIVFAKADKSTQLRVQLQDNKKEMFEKKIDLSASPQQFMIPFSQFTSRTDYQPPGAVVDRYLDLVNVSSLTFELISAGSGDVYVYNVSVYGPNEYPVNYYMSAGDKFPMINGINPSYLAPYEYRIFDEIDDNLAHNWSDVIKTSYRIIKESGNASLIPFAGQPPTRGVNMPPNWVGLDDYGNIVNNEWWYNDIHFNYKYWDAFRTLWRISLDYYWYNSTDAYDYIRQNSPYGPNNFLRNELSTKGYISTRYYYNGTVAYTLGDKQHYFGIDAVYASFFKQAGSTQEAQTLLNSVDSEWAGATWGNETYNYYGVNWAWFGTALAIGNLPNIYEQANRSSNASEIHVTSCMLLDSPDTTYLVDNDLPHPNSADACLYIWADNVILDCQNHRIFGTGKGSGVTITGYKGATIKNCNISSFYYGIHLGTANNTLIGNTILNNSRHGIYVNSENNNFLINNTACDNVVGDVWSQWSQRTTGYDNRCRAVFGFGFNDIGYSGCKYSCPAAINPPQNIHVTSCMLLYSPNTTYLVDNDIQHLNTPDACLHIWADNVTLDCQNHQILGTGGEVGVEIANKGVTVKNCNISGFYEGIFLPGYQLVANTTLIGNTVTGSSHYGIYVGSWGSTFLVNNTACGNSAGDILTPSPYLVFGHDNKCRTASRFNDTGYVGCKYSCSGIINPPQCTPTAEVCDMIDNDCDGGIDEDIVCYNLSCYDSDDGKKYYTKGYLDFQLNPWRSLDWCYNGTTLKEYYCNDQGFSAYVNYDCPYGCWDGACILPNGTTCTNSTEICDGIDNDCDSQVDENMVCGDVDIPEDEQYSSLNYTAVVDIGWPNNPVNVTLYDIRIGEINSTSVHLRWKSTQPSPSWIRIYGVTPWYYVSKEFDSYNNLKTSHDYYFTKFDHSSYSNNKNLIGFVIGKNLTSGIGIPSGYFYFVSADNQSLYICNDPDGLNYTLKSTVSLNASFSMSDTCSSGVLRERYCASKHVMGIQTVRCEYGCKDDGSCAPAQNIGCQYNNPVCSSNSTCTNNQCVLKSGCDYSNPVCGANYTCTNNQCLLKSGCWYNNPACGAGYTCTNNQCMLKSGCQYNNPACGSNYNCVNNQCVLKAGCSYNNPACQSGQICDPFNKCIMPACIKDSDCGSTYELTRMCGSGEKNNSVIRTEKQFYCVNPGSWTAVCMFRLVDTTIEVCGQGARCWIGKCENTGCQYNNPACGSNHNCVSNQCVLKTGCQYNNPACGSNYTCTNNQCVKKTGCAYNNPACGSNYICVNNQCQLKQGCQYNNPACGADYSCVNNQCVKKTGCAYNNPACSANYTCVNNQCVKKTGCAYNNPACASGYVCVGNQCKRVFGPDLYIERMYFTTTPIKNQTATLRVTLGNKGNSTASNINWDLNNGEKMIYSTSLFSLAKGQKQDLYLKFVFSKNGTHTITFRADPKSLVPEINENNNVGKTTVAVK